ncbi:MAG: hypothetical protein V3W19_04250, partial [Desulfatiglandales bacterium]
NQGAWAIKRLAESWGLRFASSFDEPIFSIVKTQFFLWFCYQWHFNWPEARGIWITPGNRTRMELEIWPTDNDAEWWQEICAHCDINGLPHRELELKPSGEPEFLKDIEWLIALAK